MASLRIGLAALVGLSSTSHAQTITTEIDYKLMYSGAFEMLNLFITDNEKLSYLLGHGCWCKKLDPIVVE